MPVLKTVTLVSADDTDVMEKLIAKAARGGACAQLSLAVH
jgi:hypothetical protein